MICLVATIYDLQNKKLKYFLSYNLGYNQFSYIKMGSGLSLTHQQVVDIIKRDLILVFNEEHINRPRYTDDGYEIFYDFSDEVKLKNKINELHKFVNNTPNYNINFYSIRK